MSNERSGPNVVPSLKRSSRTRFRGILIWSIAIVGAILLITALAVAILLNNQRFHDYLLRTAQTQASDSLGVRVQLQNFAVNFSNLSLDIYGITVDGATPYANPPLLQVDHAQVGVRIVSILHRKWYLDSFRIDRPTVRIFVDAHGNSNIPNIKSSGDSSSSNTSIFDLAIRHAELNRGEVYYNDRQSPLSADLHNVDFQASYHILLQQYSGKLAYTDGHLIAGEFRPIPHSLEAEFDATRTAFHLKNARLSSGPSQLLLSAAMQNYANPVVDAQYSMSIDGKQVREILKNASIPTGQVLTSGTAHYQQGANRTLLQSLTLNGELHSRQLDVNSASHRTQISNLAAHYSLANGDAFVNDLKLNALGGYVTASAKMNDVGGNSHSTVSGRVQGVSLAALDRMAQSSRAPQSVALSGAMNANFSAAWARSLDTLVANTDATIHGSVNRIAGSQTGTAPASATAASHSASMPLDGAVHGSYTASNGQIALHDSFLRTPQTSLTMNGVVSNRSSLAINLNASDLREVESIADLFRLPSPGQTLQPLGIEGTASFTGTVQGSTSTPHLSGELKASNLQLRGTAWKVLSAGIDATPSLVSIQHGDLEQASRGHFHFSASAELDKWSFSTESPIRAELEAAQLNIPDLNKLAGQQLPITGTISADASLHGSVMNPVGSGSVTLANLVAYDQPVSGAKLTFRGTGDEAHADLSVQTPAGGVQGKFSIRPKLKTFDAQINSGGIDLAKLQVLKARQVDATGELSLNATGQGSFDNPQVSASFQIPRLVVQKQTIADLKLQVNAADHIANATLSTSAVNTNIQAKAKVELTGDYLADAALDTQSIALQPLIALYSPEEAASLSGQTELHATLHGPLKNPKAMEAHVNIPVLKMGYGTSIQLAAAEPIHVDYKDGIVSLQKTSIRGTDTDLQLQGSVPVEGYAPSNAAMSAKLLGTVNLQLAQLFDPDIRTSGELKFNINSSGAMDDPNVGGEINIVDAAYSSADLPVGLQHGNGVLRLTRDRLSISSFQGIVGGGTVTAQGGVALRPSLQFNVGVSAQGIRMLYPQGMRESVNADLKLSGSTDAAVLGGSVQLSEVSFTPAFDISGFVSQLSGGVATPPTPGFSQNLQLNIALRSNNDMNLVSRALSISGNANLQVRGTAANPVILGRVNLNGGDVILNGDRFILNGGTVAFVNPYETQPVVNLSLKTTIQQYDVYLRFNGPVDQLRTTYNSDPALPSADIINLLAFGQTTEANANTPATPANQAAESLVASQVSSQVTSRISKIAGISQLSISPVLASGTSQGPAGAQITIQQRVTGNLFVTFSSNVASTQSQTIQGQYQLSPRVALSATRDPNGGFAVDALIKKSW
jgi:translocation and assembly module TamB